MSDDDLTAQLANAQKYVMIPDWKSESSPFGLSYWDRFQSGCMYQRVLDKKYADLILAMELGAEDASATGVGSAFHKIMEHYYRGTLGTVAFDDTVPNVIEALRLYRAYSTRFPASEFGTVVGSEVEFSLPTDLAVGMLGVPAFTGRLDLLVEIEQDKIEDLRRWDKRNLSGLTEPGVYILDHKTMGRKDRDVAKKFSNAFQFHAYQFAWDLLHPDKPVKGMIANCVVRHKELNDGSFFSVFVPPPTPVQIRALRGHLSDSYAIYLARGAEFLNRSKCYDWGRECAHFTSGACDRTEPK